MTLRSIRVFPFTLVFLGSCRKRDEQTALFSIFLKICCYIRIPEAFDAKLQVLLGTRQGSWVLEHAFQPDLGTHLILTEKGFTGDNCEISQVFLCANPGYAFWSHRQTKPLTWSLLQFPCWWAWGQDKNFSLLFLKDLNICRWKAMVHNTICGWLAEREPLFKKGWEKHRENRSRCFTESNLVAHTEW